MLDRPQRIFVTGGRGRLASFIADYFRAPTHDLTLFSRTASHGFRALESLTQPSILAGADIIFHLAWSSLPATSEQYPGIEEREDLPGLEKLLQSLARQPAAAQPHLVFFSSGGAVYGNAPGRPSVESDPCRPIGRYGRAKLAAETMIQSYAAQHGLSYTILRISNPYGYPVPKSRTQGLIPHALRCASEGQPLSLWGDGSARKDFLYYADFLSALEPVIIRRPPGVFNLSAGESHTLTEVIATVQTATGKPITLQHATAPDWDVRDSRLSPEKFMQITGWRAQVSLEEGIRRAAAGYAAH